MELGVVRLLAAEARAAGRDPAQRPDPGPAARRPVHLHRRRGGRRARRRRLDRREPPGLAARRGRAQRMRRRRDDGRRPALLPDPGRREGLSPPTGSPSAGRGATARCRATTTPRSSPRRSSTRLAVPGPTRLTPVDGPLPRAGAAGELPADAARDPARPVGRRPAAAPRPPLAVACDPMYARALRALAARHVSPDVVHAGHQVQRHPGRRRGRGRLPGPARARPSRRCARELARAARAGARGRLRRSS